MTEPVYGKDLALYKLERARDEIDTAELLFDHSKYKAANNRAYYAKSRTTTSSGGLL